MGSKILVTIQIEEAAKALGDMNPIPLWELDEEQFNFLTVHDKHRLGRKLWQNYVDCL
jgi:hypothetical protein